MGAESKVSSALQVEYEHLRARLELLLAQPEKDMAAVDRIVDELEQVQLKIKCALGLKGNNPLA